MTGRLRRSGGRARSPRWRDLAVGYEPPPPDGTGGGDAFIYVPVPRSPGPRWQTRAVALAGLMTLVSAAALTVTFGIYRLALAVNHVAQGLMAH